MATVNLGVGDTGALQAAIQQTARAIQSMTREQTASAAATRAQTTATSAAVGGLQNFASGAQATAQRIQGVANGIQSLVGHLGGRDRTAGLIGSIAGTTAQFAAMGAMLGPAGAIIGGVAGLAAGLIGAANAADTAASSADRAATSFADMGRAALDALEARTRATDISVGEIGADRSDADLRAEAEGRRSRLRELDAERRRATVEGRGADLARALAIIPQLEEDVSNLEAELARRAALPTGVEPPPASFTAETRGGGGERDTAADRGRASAEAASAWVAAVAEAENTATELRAAGDLERAEAHDAALEAMVEAQRAADEEAKALLDESIAAEQAKADAVKAANEEVLASHREVSDALAEFSRGDVGSLESVIDAYHDLQDSAKRTGVELNRTGLLMSRAMTATGNQIADTIGGQMTGAFNEALGAWMDGSKTFVEAAEGMAKGVIKALTQEAIVQAVTEIARSIASFASQDYAGGIAHAGAAAAWAAVGIAAGAVGAATGAFGGGGAKDAGTSTKDMANADRERQRGGEPGTTVINVYADNLPVTQGDLDRVMTQMVRRGIERHGERFPGIR